jgi:hypothetical protein
MIPHLLDGHGTDLFGDETGETFGSAPGRVKAK